MEIVLLLARLLLAVVFGVAGAAKAADLAGSRKAAIAFGVPEKVAAPLGYCLPFVEVLAALALLPRNTAWLGAITALALLLMFAAGIGVNLIHGRRPDCNCFGQLHSKPLSWSVFARNVLLAIVAAAIVAQGKDGAGLSAFKWLADLNAGEVASLALSVVAVLLLAAVVVYLRRALGQQASILERIDAMKRVIDEDYAEPPVERKDAVEPLDGLQVGAPAPSFSLASMSGGQVTLEDLLDYRKPVLLLFVSTNCSPCKALMPAIRVWERDYGDRLTITVLSKQTSEDKQFWDPEYETTILVQGEDKVSEQYQAKWTPAAVLVNRGGRLASRMTYGDEAIRALVSNAITGTAPANGLNESIPHVSFGGGLPLEIGQRAPGFSLTDLRGRVVSTQDLLGEDTLLLFWDPGCRYCHAMSEDLRAWEQNPPKRAPKLAIIASGDAETVRTNGRKFESLMLLDPDFSIGQLFGSKSTPSGVLIDADWRIASSLAIGGRNVLELAGVRRAELPVAASI